MCSFVYIYIFILFSQERDDLIQSLTGDLLNDNNDLTRMEFLRKLVFNRPTYTKVFLDFDAVGKLPEEEVEIEDDEGQEQEEEEEMDNILLPSTIYSTQSSQSVCSASSTASVCSSPSTSSTSSVIDRKFICGVCNKLQKSVAMECRHSVCTKCYEKMQND